MTRRYASCAAVILLACGLSFFPSQAPAHRVSTSVGEFEVSTVTGRFDDSDLATTLMDQVWWGNSALAHEFAALVADSLGVISGNFEIGPIFAYTTDVPPIFGWDVGGAAWCGVGTEAFCSGTDIFYNPGEADGFWAIAAPVSTEALLSELSALIFDINLQAGIANSLDAKLVAVLMALDDANMNNDLAALNSIYAFCNNVDAQRAGKLTEEEAVELIEAANSVIRSLDQFAPLCQ